jgi:hypothetical protein
MKSLQPTSGLYKNGFDLNPDNEGEGDVNAE